MKRRKSDIPSGAEERPTGEYEEKGSSTYLRVTECVLAGRVVGRRSYDSGGNLVIETSLKNGQKHGREYSWNEAGLLELVEPYFEGKPHGIARQYGRSGRVIGTYRLIHGTGLDIWRSEREDGSLFISEIHSLQDGLPHGYEWWLREDEHSVWHERHWEHGVLHGIERLWNNEALLQRSYPRFWIRGRVVSKRVYLKAVRDDRSLPVFQAGDNFPQRRFPAAIERLLQSGSDGGS